MHYHPSSSRNQRQKGSKVKQCVKITLLLAGFMLLLHQVKQSYEKGRDYGESSQNGISRLGRKEKASEFEVVERREDKDDLDSQFGGTLDKEREEWNDHFAIKGEKTEVNTEEQSETQTLFFSEESRVYEQGHHPVNSKSSERKIDDKEMTPGRDIVLIANDQNEIVENRTERSEGPSNTSNGVNNIEMPEDNNKTDAENSEQEEENASTKGTQVSINTSEEQDLEMTTDNKITEIKNSEQREENESPDGIQETATISNEPTLEAHNKTDMEISKQEENASTEDRELVDSTHSDAQSDIQKNTTVEVANANSDNQTDVAQNVTATSEEYIMMATENSTIRTSPTQVIETPRNTTELLDITSNETKSDEQVAGNIEQKTASNSEDFTKTTEEFQETITSNQTKIHNIETENNEQRGKETSNQSNEIKTENSTIETETSDNKSELLEIVTNTTKSDETASNSEDLSKVTEESQESTTSNQTQNHKQETKNDEQGDNGGSNHNHGITTETIASE